MNQKEFAELMSVPAPTVTRWKQRGWLMMRGDCEVDPDASLVRLKAKRGTLGRIDNRAASKRSYWSHSLHCKTNRAFEIRREWNSEADS